jgi:hypothetical protein
MDKLLLKQHLICFWSFICGLIRMGQVLGRLLTVDTADSIASGSAAAAESSNRGRLLTPSAALVFGAAL